MDESQGRNRVDRVVQPRPTRPCAELLPRTDVALKAIKPIVATVGKIKLILVTISWAMKARFQNRSAK
jgi:hypothetical protein